MRDEVGGPGDVVVTLMPDDIALAAQPHARVRIAPRRGEWTMTGGTNVMIGLWEAGLAASLITEHRPTWIYGEDGLRDGRPLAYVGRYHYRMRVVDGRLRIASKRCTLRMTSLRQVADVAIIL